MTLKGLSRTTIKSLALRATILAIDGDFLDWLILKVFKTY